MPSIFVFRLSLYFFVRSLFSVLHRPPDRDCQYGASALFIVIGAYAVCRLPVRARIVALGVHYQPSRGDSKKNTTTTKFN